ncbi:MAG: ABC transporter substrate-binding protein [Anaerolineae bacterium]|nr:ABC transporter substrate-binding protein [Anaerolineae bacterium]
MRHKVTFRVVLLALIVGMLVACTPAKPVETPDETQSVILQLQWFPQAQFAGYYVALEKGWYAEEGLDVTIRAGGPDISPATAVAGGNADFGTYMLADLASAVQQGQPLLSIAQIQQQNGLLLLAFQSSGIDDPTDFLGKRVGVWLGSWDSQFRALMTQQSIADNQYQLVSQGFSMEAFLAGELDVASAMIYNEYHVVLESGVAANELNIIDYADYGLDFPGDTLFTTKDLVEQNPDLCERMLRASLRGWEYAVANPEEAADIVLKFDVTGTQTREHQLSMMREIALLVKSSDIRPIGYTDRADVLRVVDTLQRYGVLASPVQPEEVYTNTIWESATSD